MNDSTLYLNENLFVIPDGHDLFLLYLSNPGITLSVNSPVVQLLQNIKKGKPPDASSESEIIGKLTQYGIIGTLGATREAVMSKDVASSFDPEGVSLFLTTGCNMRCIYCYSRGGATKKNLPWRYAKTAIDSLFQNALNRQRQNLYAHFHGGGEITTARKLLQKCVHYIRKHSREAGIEVKIEAGVNGVMSKTCAKWLVQNMDGVTVSLDGSPAVQNYHRPLSNGGESFDLVHATLKRFDTAGFSYGIRTTVTQEIVDTLPDSIEFIANTFKPKAIQVEPVFLSGRALDRHLKSIDPSDFIGQYREAKRRLGDRAGMLCYSGAQLKNVNGMFCQALSGKSFCVTPDGDVTSCYEITEKANPLSYFFFFGRIDHRHKKVLFNNEKLKEWRSFIESRWSFCRNCFCSPHCAGDCPAKSLIYRTVDDYQKNPRCIINRELTKDLLRESVVSVIKPPLS
jgi:uncharacterized protein